MVISKRKHNISIEIDDKKLEQVENFAYLGSTIADNGTSSNDIKTRIRKEGQLSKNSTTYGHQRKLKTNVAVPPLPARKLVHPLP